MKLKQIIFLFYWFCLIYSEDSPQIDDNIVSLRHFYLSVYEFNINYLYILRYSFLKKIY